MLSQYTPEVYFKSYYKNWSINGDTAHLSVSLSLLILIKANFNFQYIIFFFIFSCVRKLRVAFSRVGLLKSSSPPRFLWLNLAIHSLFHPQWDGVQNRMNKSEKNHTWRERQVNKWQSLQFPRYWFFPFFKAHRTFMPSTVFSEIEDPHIFQS